MTDILKGLDVVFVSDIRDDDAAQIIIAIKMIKGVLDVRPSLVGADDWMNRRQMREDLISKWWELINEVYYPRIQNNDT